MAGSCNICVVGGVNVDITGLPNDKLLSGDSNPGQVSLSLGGVGRNIAESLARLGANVRLVTLLGDDLHAEWIRRGCEHAGIDLSLSGVLEGMPSGMYLCINDERGNLCTAISDMRLCDAITPAYLAERLPALNSADAVVLDANLPEITLRWLADAVHVPLAADPVSVKKAPRLRGILPSLALLKPNQPETLAILGSHEDNCDPLSIAKALTERGVRNVLMTLGSQGVCYADENLSGFQPCLTGPVVSTNGCGDASLSAGLVAILEGRDIREAALLGQAAAAICARSPKAVNPEMTWDAVCGLAFRHSKRLEEISC